MARYQGLKPAGSLKEWSCRTAIYRVCRPPQNTQLIVIVLTRGDLMPLQQTEEGGTTAPPLWWEVCTIATRQRLAQLLLFDVCKFQV